MLLEITKNQIFFYFALIILFFLPGYLLLLALFGKSQKILSSFERFVFSFGLGIILANLTAFIFFKLEVALTGGSSLAGATILSCVLFLIYKIRFGKKEVAGSEKFFNFSRSEIILFFLLVFLMFFLKTAFLSSAIAPTATDMGHHLYWVKWISQNHTLPDYEGMPDFIVGEHIALSEILMLTGADIFGFFPVVFLYLLNILGIFSVFLLVGRVFKNNLVRLLSLFLLGTLYAVSSPQVRFVSGGVIGNIFGNYYLPMALYFFYRAFELWEKKETLQKENRGFLFLAILVSAGLFYTHHLSGFIFLFVLFFIALFFFLFNLKGGKNIFLEAVKSFLSPWTIIPLAASLLFVFFIFTPTYLDPQAVETAVGAPSKATREGLSLSNIRSSMGDVHLALGLFGFAFLIFSTLRKKWGTAMMAGWFLAVFLMSTIPKILFINLPSDRIGNYLSYPLAVMAALGMATLYKPDFFSKNLILRPFLSSAFILVFALSLIQGVTDSAQNFKKSLDFSSTLETFSAAEYLSTQTDKRDIILKDHNYLTGDTWMKIFFLRGYDYPLSRGYFKRYEDPTKPREMCTLQMISDPAGKEAAGCFSETGVNFIAVNPAYDSAQFKKLNNFDQIYSGKNITVYHKIDAGK